MFKYIINLLKKLGHDVKGEVSRVIEIVVSLFVAGILLPIAIIEIAGQTTNMVGNGTNAAVVTVITVLLPVLAVIGIAMLYLKYVRK